MSDLKFLLLSRISLVSGLYNPFTRLLSLPVIMTENSSSDSCMSRSICFILSLSICKFLFLSNQYPMINENRSVFNDKTTLTQTVFLVEHAHRRQDNACCDGCRRLCPQHAAAHAETYKSFLLKKLPFVLSPSAFTSDCCNYTARKMRCLVIDWMVVQKSRKTF